jgi:hypothetical protein
VKRAGGEAGMCQQEYNELIATSRPANRSTTPIHDQQHDDGDPRTHVAHTGQMLTWDQAMGSKETSGPTGWTNAAWCRSGTAGITKFV